MEKMTKSEIREKLFNRILDRSERNNPTQMNPEAYENAVFKSKKELEEIEAKKKLEEEKTNLSKQKPRQTVNTEMLLDRFLAKMSAAVDNRDDIQLVYGILDMLTDNHTISEKLKGELTRFLQEYSNKNNLGIEVLVSKPIKGIRI